MKVNWSNSPFCPRLLFRLGEIFSILYFLIIHILLPCQDLASILHTFWTSEIVWGDRILQNPREILAGTCYHWWWRHVLNLIYINTANHTVQTLISTTNCISMTTLLNDDNYRWAWGLTWCSDWIHWMQASSQSSGTASCFLPCSHCFTLCSIEIMEPQNTYEKIPQQIMNWGIMQKTHEGITFKMSRNNTVAEYWVETKKYPFIIHVPHKFSSFVTHESGKLESPKTQHETSVTVNSILHMQNSEIFIPLLCRIDSVNQIEGKMPFRNDTKFIILC